MQAYSFPNTDFPTFPTFLNVGTSDKKPQTIADRSEVLAILDSSASMTDYINLKDKTAGNKIMVAKKLLVDLETLGFKVTILPFNDKTHKLTTTKDILEPSSSTCFTSIPPTLSSVFALHKFSSVILLSDGLASEDKTLALKAITDSRRIVCENNCNTVSVAVGDDADGKACATFAGNRGYETFVKDVKTLSNVVDDIKNGMLCSYVMLPSGEYIPVENDGHYYFLSSKIDEQMFTPSNFDVMFKFLNLVILQKLSEPSPDYNQLSSFITHTCSSEVNTDKRKMLVDHFTKLISSIRVTTKESCNEATPGYSSALKYNARLCSKQT